MNNVLLLKQKEIFLESLAQNGNVTQAARLAGWKYPTIAEEYRKEDPDFDRAWFDAKRQANDSLIAEARRRAVDGIEEPVFYKGQLCGSITKYSDKLLETLLKGEMPEKFREMEKSGDERPGVLVIPRSAETIDINDWEENAAQQQQALLARTE